MQTDGNDFREKGRIKPKLLNGIKRFDIINCPCGDDASSTVILGTQEIFQMDIPTNRCHLDHGPIIVISIPLLSKGSS